jgi:hypothetical protein
VLILNKLLKTKAAQIGQNAAYAVLEYTTSTRDFRGNGSPARSLLELRKTADRLTERYGLSPSVEGYYSHGPPPKPPGGVKVSTGGRGLQFALFPFAFLVFTSAPSILNAERLSRNGGYPHNDREVQPPQLDQKDSMAGVILSPGALPVSCDRD